MKAQRTVPLVTALVIVCAACSSGDEPSLGAPVAAVTSHVGSSNDADASDVTTESAASVAPALEEDGTTAPPQSDAPAASTAPPTVGNDGVAGDDGAATDQTSIEPPPIDTVPETGVPGLDSDDRFCAAWSRFGGTWQVLIVGSQFLDDPGRVARWEIAAAPVIEDAYDELTATLPPEAAGEAVAVLDQYFGALARRSEVAGAALRTAGASDEQIADLADRWVAALATRSNDSPGVRLELDAELEALVGAAAAGFQQQRVPIHTDPSMFVAVETPAIDGYIASTCPDQGTLSGAEVDP